MLGGFLLIRISKYISLFLLKQVLSRLLYFVLGLSFSFLLSHMWGSVSFRQQTGHVTQSDEESHDNFDRLHVQQQVQQRSVDTHSIVAQNYREREARTGFQRERKRCVKSLHIFADFQLVIGNHDLKHFESLLEGSNETDHASDLECMSLGYKCDLRISMGVDINSFKGKDAVIFGMLMSQWRDNNTLLQRILEASPEPGQTWIYYSTEPPYRVARASHTLDVARFKYHVLMTYDSRSDIHIPFGYFKRFANTDESPTDTRFLSDEFYNVNRTGLISWVATNCLVVFWPRYHFVEELKFTLLPSLATYGKCGIKKCYPPRSEVCNQLFASYKFFLALPNSECHEYITEKFWMMSLKYGAVSRSRRGAQGRLHQGGSSEFVHSRRRL